MSNLVPKPQVLLFLALFIFLLYWLAQWNYVFFHSVISGFGILVAALIYVLATKTYRHSQSNFLLFLGILYFFEAVLIFFHSITYKGVNILPGYDTNIPTQLWIAGQYVYALSVFLAPMFAQRKFNYAMVFGVFTAIISLLLIAILVLQVFPDCFIEGVGLTSFKITSEYIISLLLLGAMVHLYHRKTEINLQLYQIIQLTLAISVLAELSFTLYTDVYGIMNFAGHLLNLISYYFVYQGVILRGLEAPYDLIFAIQKEHTIIDYLTGLYNRQGFIEFTRKELAIARRDRHTLGLLLIDIDQFSRVNDAHGHLAGDHVLKKFAGMLKENLHETDIACRLGGDEFVAILNKVNQKDLELTKRRIKIALQNWALKDETVQGLSLSIGTALWEPGQARDLDDLLVEAYQEIYKEKEARII